jgi:hypothetical protein
MIGETSKRKQDLGEAIKFYLKGIVFEPSYTENFLDLAQLVSSVGEIELSNILVIFAKTIQQIKTLQQADRPDNQEDIIFEIEDDERGPDTENVQTDSATV